MPRDNRCMYMAHVFFNVCCSDCVGVCGNVCYLAAAVKDRLYECVVDVMDVVFSVCIVTRGAVGACVWEV